MFVRYKIVLSNITICCCIFNKKHKYVWSFGTNVACRIEFLDLQPQIVLRMVSQKSSVSVSLVYSRLFDNCQDDSPLCSTQYHVTSSLVLANMARVAFLRCHRAASLSSSLFLDLGRPTLRLVKPTTWPTWVRTLHDPTQEPRYLPDLWQHHRAYQDQCEA